LSASKSKDRFSLRIVSSNIYPLRAPPQTIGIDAFGSNSLPLQTLRVKDEFGRGSEVKCRRRRRSRKNIESSEKVRNIVDQCQSIEERGSDASLKNKMCSYGRKFVSKE
jgi:hypothetical protein